MEATVPFYPRPLEQASSHSTPSVLFLPFPQHLVNDLSPSECSEDRARVTTSPSGYRHWHNPCPSIRARVSITGSIHYNVAVTTGLQGATKSNRQCHCWSHDTCCHHLPSSACFFLQDSWRRKRRFPSLCGPKVMPAVQSRGDPSPGHPVKPRRYDGTASPSTGTFITTR